MTPSLNTAVTGAIQVRSAEKEDFPAWQPLWLSYNAMYGRHGETALSPEITQTSWTRCFDAGIAGKLIEEIHARANTAGCGRVYWQTNPGNTSAVKVYDKIAQRSEFIVYRKTL
ncbi:hypothetical protein RCH08_001389 [Janthinobacterium sp. CG_S6]|nr:hypothetical protein [Janthinobacterium sp. CG_S6]